MKLVNNLLGKISRQITISKKNLEADLELCKDVFKTTHVPFPALGNWGYLIFLRAGPHVHSNEVSSNKRRSERVDVDMKD